VIVFYFSGREEKAQKGKKRKRTRKKEGERTKGFWAKAFVKYYKEELGFNAGEAALINTLVMRPIVRKARRSKEQRKMMSEQGCFPVGYSAGIYALRQREILRKVKRVVGKCPAVMIGRERDTRDKVPGG